MIAVPFFSFSLSPLSFLTVVLSSSPSSSCLSSKTTDPPPSPRQFSFHLPSLGASSFSLFLHFFYFFSLSFPSIRDCTFSARFNLDDPHSAILSTLPSSLLFTFTTLHESNTREEARNRALSHEHGSIEWPIVIGGHDPPFLTFLDRWWKYYVQSFRNTVEQ